MPYAYGSVWRREIADIFILHFILAQVPPGTLCSLLLPAELARLLPSPSIALPCRQWEFSFAVSCFIVPRPSYWILLESITFATGEAFVGWLYTIGDGPIVSWELFRFEVLHSQAFEKRSWYEIYLAEPRHYPPSQEKALVLSSNISLPITK